MFDMRMQAMSFREKNSWVFLVLTVLGVGTYLAIVLSRAQGVPLTEVAYVAPMLWTIGAAIAAGIVGAVVVAASRPEDAGEDERDREIGRFGIYAGQGFGVLGGVTALGLAMARASYFWIAHALCAGFVLSALVGTIARLVAYRRGVPR
jgi:hypothetical protein